MRARRETGFKPNTLTQRLPTISEVAGRYWALPMGILTPDQAPALEQLASQAERAAGKIEAKAYYSAWLQYEIGLTKHVVDPEASFSHFVKAERNLNRLAGQPQNGKRQRLIDRRDLLLIGLLRSRHDPNEREYRLQQRAAARGLGEIVIDAIAQTDGLTRRGNAFHEIQGIVTESSIAGTFLVETADTGDAITIPAPSSPRQDRPASGQNFSFNRAIPHIQTCHAIDYTLYRYHGSEVTPAAITPLQVKTSEGISNEKRGRYDPSIAFASGDTDLFCSTLSEFSNLGHQLIEYGRKKTVGNELATARGNLEFMLELHDQQKM